MRNKFSRITLGAAVRWCSARRCWAAVYFLTMIAIFSACSREEKSAPAKIVITELPYNEFVLRDLHEFDVSATPWSIAGNVSMDRQKHHHVEKQEGESILVGVGKNDRLPTRLQHNDLDLKLDFMLSRNAGVKLLLQGRYALALTDSWMSDSTAGGMCGAVYDSLAGKMLQPLLNACRAPGLWQKLYVKFKAPRFDKTGKKIANARFDEVVLNGKLIHQGVELKNAHPEGGFNDETENGPLMLVGDSGPVAFRNIQYKSYKHARIALHGIHYQVYKGLYKSYDTLKSFMPLRGGTTDSLHWGLGDKRAQIAFEGTMDVPATGDYLFKLRAGGPAWLLVDSGEVVNNKNTREYTHAFYGKVNLTQGKHNFKIVYANYDESLVLEYAGPDIPLTPLTVASSERKVKAIEPFKYPIATEAVVQRGFFTHRGKVNPYAICVGWPGGLNYAYDLTTFNLLSVWHGDFIDVSNMWTERGESQMAIPLGAPLELSGFPSVLERASEDEAWTDTVVVDKNIYERRGYRLGDNGLPVFFYSYNNTSFSDQFIPAEKNRGWVRNTTVTFGQPSKALYFLLGSGGVIEMLPGGGYTIDDKAYYVESFEGADIKKIRIVQAENGRYELLLPLEGQAGTTVSFKYSILW